MKGKHKTAIRKKVTKPVKTASSTAASFPVEKTSEASPVMTVEAIPTAETLTTPSIPETNSQTPTPPAPSELDQPKTPEETASELDHKNSFLFIVGLVVFLVIIVGTGLFAAFLFTQSNKEVVTAPVETAQPSPSPEEELDRSVFVFEVLNGSGVSGAAAKAQEQLEDLGYTVIKTGNADRQNYTETKIYVSEELEGKADIFLEEIKLEYANATFSGILTSAKDSTASARIIIGKNE